VLMVWVPFLGVISVLRNGFSNFRFQESENGSGRFRRIFVGGRDCSVNHIGEGTDMIQAGQLPGMRHEGKQKGDPG